MLCSLIYAMAVQAESLPSDTMTAELVFLDGSRKPVRDCALFMPHLGQETNSLMQNLKTLGFSPQVSSDITVEKLEFQDSNGHLVDEYKTNFAKRIGYYGKNTVLMSLQGYYIERRKKRIAILKLHRLGDQEEVASSTFSAVAQIGRAHV